MPRIHSYRERLYMNLYDAVNLSTFDKYARIFGNANIGDRSLTNMMVAGQLVCDMTFIIANMYTRTNLSPPRPKLTDEAREKLKQLFVDGHDGDAIGTLLRDMQWERSPLARALEEWSHVARVELVIGNKPMFEMNFHDLMDGPALGPTHRPPLTISKVTNDLQHVVDIEKTPPPELPWRKCIARPILVPVRQNLSVTIDAPEAPTRALRKLATEAGVTPHPLAWVHLEGLATRDIQ